MYQYINTYFHCIQLVDSLLSIEIPTFALYISPISDVQSVDASQLSATLPQTVYSSFPSGFNVLFVASTSEAIILYL